MNKYMVNVQLTVETIVLLKADTIEAALAQAREIPAGDLYRSTRKVDAINDHYTEVTGAWNDE